MKKTISLLSVALLFLLANVNKCYSQNCSKEKAEKIEDGFPKIKYCMENLGWRESVKKNEWRVTVYNLYDDVNVNIAFTLIEKGAEAKGLGSYTIKIGGSRSYSFYFSSAPEFVYDDIELVEPKLSNQ